MASSFTLSLKRVFPVSWFRYSGYNLVASHNYSRNMAEQPVKNITFDSLKEKLSKQDITLIDVREPNELKDDGKIPHSVNIPLGQISQAFQLPDSEFRLKYGIEKPGEEDGFVVSCRSGKRATNAFNKLSPLGYKNVLVYTGSFQDWLKNGGPIEKSS